MFDLRFAHTVSLLLSIAGLITSCGGESETLNAEELGQARLKIEVVPPSVRCLQIEADSGFHTYHHEAEVLPGENAVIDVGPLPTGELTFTGLAYPQLCTQVTPSSVPSWFSEPTPAILVQGVTADITLTMTQGTDANITVDFTSNASCTAPEVDCFGTCANLQSDELNCGACGQACDFGQLCLDGTCENAFEADFVSGQPSSSCGEWFDFTNGLNGAPYSEVIFTSSEGPTQFTCSQPGPANQICMQLRNQGSISIQCDGNVWQVRNCSGGAVLSVSPNFVGACNCGAQNAVRPCAPGIDWGGANGLTCGAPSQTLGVICRQ